ncbi:MAG: UDP-N-acetylmuramoyl-L-alanyl-D-glutamate--2,6-diaminopimelate ligase [Deltaproteobacteria bacterium]|nr:UDP-N-acetylmuramoyl-L-alanyl-D-glutamate--2,6-diaminopimelate ligase [Deltaproteobacteria bacterium]
MLRLNPYTELAYHSKACKPGCCFVAISGLQTDGHQYISEAVRNGAKTVVVEREVDVPRGVAKIVVEDSRDALARLSAFHFNEPTRELTLVGVTGTNGKTTVTSLLSHIAKQAGLSSGLLGTLHTPSGRTTPESYDLQKIFRNMAAGGATHAFMEVTSHALQLKRVTGCHFNGAVFTNLSRDHLDFHENMENYFSQKARLFRQHLVVSEKKNLWAVINADDPYGRTLAGDLPARVWLFSQKGGAEISLQGAAAAWEGLKLEVKTPQGTVSLHSPLKGRFQVNNLLAAVAASLAMEFPMEAITAGIASFSGVPGRMEAVPNGRKNKIVVDYAHTPAALENVLEALRELNPERIITVFGCGGDRDRGKRPQMGKIASQKSDILVVTSDNPRSEDPQKILNEILGGVQPGTEKYAVADRRAAIARALDLAKEGDCVLIAGKGHETFQEIAGEKKPFDDREVVRELLGIRTKD